MKLLLAISFALFFAQTAIAAPAITSVSAVVEHGDSLVIAGSGFGTKSPAKPLMWDDCESGTVGVAPSTSTENSASQVAYSQINPTSAASEPFKIMYRAVGYDPVNTEVAGPHTHSKKYISGGHENVSGDGARDVTLTVATPSSYAERWFMQFYYRVDPDWPSPCDVPNHKITTFQDGTAAYASGNNQFSIITTQHLFHVMMASLCILKRRQLLRLIRGTA
jgi:hypothetical protein